MSEPESALNKKLPLSQAPAKRKLLVALPSTAGFALLWHVLGAVYPDSGDHSPITGGPTILWYVGIAKSLAGTLAIFLGAYSLVGCIEILGGQSLADAAKNWDHLAGWKKFLISIAVIAVAITVASFLIALVGESMMR